VAYKREGKLQVENGTSFCPDEIFELYPESQREINAKPEPGGYK